MTSEQTIDRFQEILAKDRELVARIYDALTWGYWERTQNKKMQLISQILQDKHDFNHEWLT